MTDEEIYQQIEEYREESDALYEKIHEQVEASIVSHAQKKKRRKKFFAGVLSVVAVLIVTLSIVLPIVMKPQVDEIRYSDADILLPDALESNLKEYCVATNQSFLYLDWYEDAEDLHTARYYEEGKESDTVYLYEKFTDGNTGYTFKLSVLKQNIVVESLDEPFEEPKIIEINNTQVYYVLQRTVTSAKFEYQGYKYYLEINDGVTLEFLVETIESMFNN